MRYCARIAGHLARLHGRVVSLRTEMEELIKWLSDMTAEKSPGSAADTPNARKWGDVSRDLKEAATCLCSARRRLEHQARNPLVAAAPRSERREIRAEAAKTTVNSELARDLQHEAEGLSLRADLLRQLALAQTKRAARRPGGAPAPPAALAVPAHPDLGPEETEQGGLREREKAGRRAEVGAAYAERAKAGAEEAAAHAKSAAEHAERARDVAQQADKRAEAAEERTEAAAAEAALAATAANEAAQRAQSTATSLGRAFWHRLRHPFNRPGTQAPQAPERAHAEVDTATAASLVQSAATQVAEAHSRLAAVGNPDAVTRAFQADLDVLAEMSLSLRQRCSPEDGGHPVGGENERDRSGEGARV